MALGPDGALWFSLPAYDRIGRVTPQGELGFLQLEPSSLPRGIAFDPAGRLWVTTFGMTRIELSP